MRFLPEEIGRIKKYDFGFYKFGPTDKQIIQLELLKILKEDLFLGFSIHVTQSH